MSISWWQILILLSLVISLLCQIIYEALETQILLIKFCDYLSMSNNLYGARETNIVLIVLYTLWLCDHFPYPYGFLILYGSTEMNDMIWYKMPVLLTCKKWHFQCRHTFFEFEVHCVLRVVNCFSECCMCFIPGNDLIKRYRKVWVSLWLAVVNT